MKHMDEVAGITAAKYCKTNVVTASMDTVNFHKAIKRGMFALKIHQFQDCRRH